MISKTGIALEKWKGGASAPLTMFFDDGVESHLSNAIPALVERGLTGTFYLNPGANWFDRPAWEKIAAGTKMEFGNHSMTHKGAGGPEEGEEEISRCNEFILGLHPERTIPRLISFAYPGGTNWKVPETQKRKTLRKYNLVLRPPTSGKSAGVQVKTGQGLMDIVREGLFTGNQIVIGFHGVGGDWLSVDLEAYIELLDFVSGEKDKLWVSDPVSVHKYETELKKAEIRMLDCGKDRFSFGLSCDLCSLYGEPLTVSLEKPAGWKSLRISQAGRRLDCRQHKKRFIFDAAPNGGKIVVSE